METLENLGKVAEKAKEVPDVIVERLLYWQEQLDRARADREYLDHQAQLVAVPTRAQLNERIQQMIPQLKEMARTVRSELKVAVTKIEAVPYQQFGSDKIVLRRAIQTGPRRASSSSGARGSGRPLQRPDRGTI